MTATKLTRLASQKFSEMVENTEELQSRVHATISKIKAAENQLSIIANRETKDAKEEVAALTDEIKRLDQRRSELQSKYMQQSRLLTAIRTWLNGVPANVELRDVGHGKFTAVVDGEGTDTAIYSLRAEIEKLQNARRSVMRAVPPLDILHAAASARVRELADRGRPVIAVDKGAAHIRFPAESSFGSGSARDAMAFACWISPEAVEAKLREQIDAMRTAEQRTNTPVMPMAERDRRVAEIDAKILAAERDEEYLIVIGEDFGLHVPRREDANPLAILCLSMQPKKRAERELVSALDKA